MALDTLLTVQSITKGAEQLNMSPSALSNSLSRLRDYFEDDLLTQIGRRMVITPMGESLKANVRNALNNIENTILRYSLASTRKQPTEYSVCFAQITRKPF